MYDFPQISQNISEQTKSCALLRVILGCAGVVPPDTALRNAMVTIFNNIRRTAGATDMNKLVCFYSIYS